ncbi:MAG: hypothetical protein AB1489_26825 [Acidobacteriota bacterium]
MVSTAITVPYPSTRISEGHARTPYWSIMHGEFPWCLDDSEQAGTPSELIGGFDLIVAVPPPLMHSTGARMRTPLDRCRPDTSWLPYAELFLRMHGSLFVFAPLEAIGAYVNAITEVGLDYHTTYLWNGGTDEAVAALIWAAKDTPLGGPLPNVNGLLNISTSTTRLAEEREEWLYELLVENFTQPEMTVLEPFMAGSRLLSVCQKRQRYCLAVARKRSHIKQAEQLLLGGLKQTA